MKKWFFNSIFLSNEISGDKFAKRVLLNSTRNALFSMFTIHTSKDFLYLRSFLFNKVFFPREAILI